MPTDLERQEHRRARDHARRMRRKHITILSLGAGIQSTTMMLMAEAGEIPRPEAAIFADTKWEPSYVYDQIEWLREHTTIPIHTVSTGDLRQDALDGKPKAWLPVYTTNLDGAPAMLRRQCTSSYKVIPIRRKAREIMNAVGAKWLYMQLGITTDEFQRVRDGDAQFITNAYPLIDLRLTRDDCTQWLIDKGYPLPRKSSCIGCPFHGMERWRDMRENQPLDFANAVEFEAQLSLNNKRYDAVYLTGKRIPLDQIDFNQTSGTADTFEDECQGVCGV